MNYKINSPEFNPIYLYATDIKKSPFQFYKRFKPLTIYKSMQLNDIFFSKSPVISSNYSFLSGYSMHLYLNSKLLSYLKIDHLNSEIFFPTLLQSPYLLYLKFKLNLSINMLPFNKTDLFSTLNFKRFFLSFNDSNYYHFYLDMKSQLMKSDTFSFLNTKFVSVESQISNFFLLNKYLIQNRFFSFNDTFYFTYLKLPSLFNLNSEGLHIKKNIFSFMHFIFNVSSLNHYLLTKFYYYNNKISFTNKWFHLKNSFDSYSDLSVSSYNKDSFSVLNDISFPFFFYDQFLNSINNNSFLVLNFDRVRSKFNFYMYRRKLKEFMYSYVVLKKNLNLKEKYLDYDNYYNYHNPNIFLLNLNFFSKQHKNTYLLSENSIFDSNPLFQTQVNNFNNNLYIPFFNYNDFNINNIFSFIISKHLLLNNKSNLFLLSLKNIYPKVLLNLKKKNIFQSKKNVLKLRSLYYFKMNSFLTHFKMNNVNNFFFNKKRLALRRNLIKKKIKLDFFKEFNILEMPVFVTNVLKRHFQNVSDKTMKYIYSSVLFENYQRIFYIRHSGSILSEVGGSINLC